jgi:flagella basal body P-ring formation protein FlgA
MIPLAAFAISGCLAVGASSDHVLAGDLAVRFPEWAVVPAATTLGLTPAPGAERVLRVLELRRMAERWNVTPAPERDICVTRPAAPVTPVRYLSAMKKELPEASIELLDFSRMPAPEGELVFPAAGLRQSASGGYWNGYITYGERHRFVLWARVKVTMKVARVVAVSDLKAGQALDGNTVRLETRDAIPATGYLTTLEETVGKVPRRSVAAGAALRAEWLEAAKAVLRGDTVEVEAVHGAAHLTLEGIAEASGALGDLIAVRNPVSRQLFQARVTAKGRVLASR